MASQRINKVTIYSGSGRHADKRTRRARTRSAAKRKAIAQAQ